MGTCHRGGYLFSRYWYKERYHFSQFLYKERYLFSRFLCEIHKVGYTFSKNWRKVGYAFQKIGIRNGYVFEVSMARPRPKSGQVHPLGYLPDDGGPIFNVYGAAAASPRPLRACPQFQNYLLLDLMKN